MHRGPDLKRDERSTRERQQPALPPLATGIALAIWITVMLVFALVVVPAAFGSCTGPPPAP